MRTIYLLVGLFVGAVVVGGASAFVAQGWLGDDSSAAPEVQTDPVCPRAERVSWQKLADEIRAPVYCPTWLPPPLQGKFGGPFFNGRSVDPDRSYLVSFVWVETGPGGIVSEVHVNLRGYPGTTRMPVCEDTLTVGGKTVRKKIPCFSDYQARKRFGRTTVSVYTANQGADMWHVLYAWRHRGSLYTLSEHVAPPYTFKQVVGHLDLMMSTFVRLDPKT